MNTRKSGPKQKFSDGALLEMHAEKKSTAQISSALGIHKSTVHVAFKRLGLTSNWRRVVVGGDRFGKYVVLREVNPRKRASDVCVRMVLARCDCGTEKTVRLDSLTSGTTVSCGCFHLEQARNHGRARRTHGKAKTRMYMVWEAMKQRCHNPRNKSYWRYGARGISVCDEWRNSFEAFAEYVGERPEGKTIDRIDSGGNYEPGNVRWATYTEQARNTRRNIFVVANGREMTLPEACELLSINYETARRSIRKHGQFQGVIHVR